MSFYAVSTGFENSLADILRSELKIENTHIKTISSLLKQFAKSEFDKANIKQFLKNNIATYFKLLNKYASGAEVTPLQEFTIRRALEIFVYVVDSTQIYESIIKKFSKVVNIMAQEQPQINNIKEFMRIYSLFLDKVSLQVVQKLANKSLLIFYYIVKNTYDIETQAITIEVIFKLLQHCDSSAVNEELFEISRVINICTINGRNMYRNIRIMLDSLNDHSESIFSINCSTIEIDSRRVVEFTDAVISDDIWLDFNMMHQKLSFFCDKTFFDFIGTVKFHGSTTWEILSFYAKDVLITTFSYDSMTENLKICLKIQLSNLNITPIVKYNKIKNLEISISRYADRFYKLLQVVLPIFFPETFRAESLNVPPSKEGDSSETPDIGVNKSNDSTVVIERFEVAPTNLATSKNYSLMNMSDPVVILTDDEEEVSIVEVDGSNRVGGNKTKIVTYNLCTEGENELETEPVPDAVKIPSSSKQPIFDLTIENNDQENVDIEVPTMKKTRDDSRNANNEYASSMLDLTCQTDNRENVEIPEPGHKMSLSNPNLNKSASPLSFNSSVIERSSKKLKKQRTKKISMANIELTEKRANQKKNSTIEEKEKIRVSTRLFAPIVNEKKKTIGTEDKRNKKEKKNGFNSTDDIETVLEAINDSNTLNHSVFKVTDWLNNVPLNVTPDVEPPEKNGSVHKVTKWLSEVPLNVTPYDIEPPEKNDSVHKVTEWLSEVPQNITPDEIEPQKKDVEISSERGSNLPTDYQNSEKSSEMPIEKNSEMPIEKSSEVPIEKQIELMMHEKSATPEGVELEKETSQLVNNKLAKTTEDLLHILGSQSSKRSSQAKTTEAPIKTNSEMSRAELRSIDSDDIPLSALAKKLTKDTSQVKSGKIVSNKAESSKNKKQKGSHNENLRPNESDANRTKPSTSVASEAEKFFQNEPVKKVHEPNDSDVFNQDTEDTEKSYLDDVLVSTKKSPFDDVTDVFNKDTEDTEKSHLDDVLVTTKKSNRGPADVSVESSTKKTTRKLYNPEDLSYLSNTITDFQLEENNNSTNVALYYPQFSFVKEYSNKTNLKANKSNEKKPSEKKKPSANKNHSKVTVERKQNVKLERKQNVKLERKQNVKLERKQNVKLERKQNVKLENTTFGKVFNNLKQNVRNQKNEAKPRRKSKNKKLASPSSASSLEPFTVALNRLRAKRRSGSPVKDESEKKKRQKVNDKIQVISNVLLRPGASQVPSQSNGEEECHCCKHLVDTANQFYLKFIGHVQKCKPKLLKNEECNEIGAILRLCSDKY